MLHIVIGTVVSGHEPRTVASWSDDGHVLHVCHLHGLRLEGRKLSRPLDRSVSFVLAVLDSECCVRFQAKEAVLRLLLTA
jgi:hypothetical protein